MRYYSINLGDKSILKLKIFRFYSLIKGDLPLNLKINNSSGKNGITL